MKISRTMTYAVQAMLQLALSDTNGPVSCKRLAHDGRMPERFLLQVLRTLVTHHFLESVRGVEGGYYLAKTASQINMLDIYEAFEQPVIPSVPPLEALPDEARSLLADVMMRAASAAGRELSTLTLADLIAGAEPMNQE